jgi:hypothetical protein
MGADALAGAAAQVRMPSADQFGGKFMTLAVRELCRGRGV